MQTRKRYERTKIVTRFTICAIVNLKLEFNVKDASVLHQQKLV